MLIAQENAQFIHHPRDRAIGITIGAIESATRMGIDKPQSGQPGRDRHRPSAIGCRTQQCSRPQQEAPSVHRDILGGGSRGHPPLLAAADILSSTRRALAPRTRSLIADRSPFAVSTRIIVLLSSSHGPPIASCSAADAEPQKCGKGCSIDGCVFAVAFVAAGGGVDGFGQRGGSKGGGFAGRRRIAVEGGSLTRPAADAAD
jgi:hypothetical protein